MKILDVLQKEAIITDLKSMNKPGVLNELVAPAARLSNTSPEEMVRVLMEREGLGSTGIGDGIGIPHGKLNGIDQTILGFGISKKGVDFESIDGKPTYLFFLLITPENATDIHLKLLARISRLLKKDPFKELLVNASTRDEVISIIKNEDEEF